MDKLLFEPPFSLWGSRSLRILGRTCRAALFQLLFWTRGQCWYFFHLWGACTGVPTCARLFNPQDSRAGVASPLFSFHRISWNAGSPSDSRSHALTLWRLLEKGPQAGTGWVCPGHTAPGLASQNLAPSPGHRGHSVPRALP